MGENAEFKLLDKLLVGLSFWESAVRWIFLVINCIICLTFVLNQFRKALRLKDLVEAMF